MRRSRVLLGVAVLAMVASVSEAKPKRKRGRVVRVERTLAGVRVPRVCANIQPDGTVSCWYHDVRIGEQLSVLDENGRRAVLEVRSMQPQLDGCNNAVGWTVTTSAQSGDLGQPSWTTIAVIDWETSSKSRVLVNNGQLQPPSGNPSESIMYAVDDDQDGDPELVATYFTCDQVGQIQQQYGTGYGCIGYYGREGAGMRLLRVDIQKTC